MLPGGDPRKAELLYEGRITLLKMNRAKTQGTYQIELDDKSGRGWKQGIIKDFPRKRLIAWDLLQRCLNAALGDARK